MIPNIILIGAGNLATQLGLNLMNNGFNIRQVFSRSEKNASILADKLNAFHTCDLNELQKKCDLYIIAVSDSAINEVIQELPPIDGIVVHTAGSISSDILNKFDNYGIFYPFQTFSKERNVDFKDIPCLIEGSNSTCEQTLIKIANKISEQVIPCNSEQRKKIHLAAIFACNFSNHLYKIAFDLLNESNIDPEVIKPLISETAQKIQKLSPKDAQTGPASRGDKDVINMHKEMLHRNKDLQTIYDLFSDRIINNK